jgi:RNA polymerase sigma-70 factor (ECF subfamily)
VRARPPEAEDILQETFIAAWKGARSFKGESKVSTWLISLARNKLTDFYRSRKKETPLDQAIGAADKSTLDGLDDEIDVKTVCLSMPEEDRELIHLIFHMGFNYSEAGDVMRIPEGTVKSRMHRIKGLIKSTLVTGGGYNG